MNFEYLEQYQHPASAVLCVTDACNLACTYCFVEQHPHFMELNTAKRAVDWLAANLKWQKERELVPENHLCNLCFFGGEPTLLFDEIVIPTLIYIEKTYPKMFHIGITTNGTLLSEERIIELSKHHLNSLLLSIDGDKESQDINRPCQDETSSFDKVHKNIPYILKYYPNATFRSTCSQETTKNIFQNYLFAEAEGFKHYFIMPNHRSENWSQQNIEELKQGCQDIYMYQANQFLNQIKPMNCSFVNESYAQILRHDIQALTNQEPIKKSLLRCGLGTNSCAIGYDGTIYACQEQPSKDETNLFTIGNIFNNIQVDKDKHIRILDFYINKGEMSCSIPERCNDCLLKGQCELKDCPSTSFDLFKNFNMITNIECIWLEENLKNAMVSMKILTDAKCYYFEKYLIENVYLYRKYFLQPEQLKEE